MKAKKVNKKWGYEIWMANNKGENYCGKILYIKKGNATSMHFHANKHETFYMLEGELQIDILDTKNTKTHTKTLQVGEVFVLDRLVPHMLKAITGDVKFVEISTYHDDDDSYRVYRQLES